MEEILVRREEKRKMQPVVIFLIGIVLLVLNRYALPGLLITGLTWVQEAAFSVSAGLLLYLAAMGVENAGRDDLMMLTMMLVVSLGSVVLRLFSKGKS